MTIRGNYCSFRVIKISPERCIGASSPISKYNSIKDIYYSYLKLILDEN